MTEAVIHIKDPYLLTLVRLELERNGITVSSKSDNCFLFITDSNTEPHFKYNYKLGICKEHESLDDSFNAILRRPVDLSELRLTVTKLFENRNSTKQKDATELYTLPEEKAVLLDGHRIKLTSNEFIILNALLEAKGEPVSRQALNNIIDSEKNSADVYICYLRKKLLFDGKNPIITVRGKGYACIIK